MGATLVRELTVGGAAYIPTGRGLAISRTPPHVLYQNYCVQAMRDGARICAYLAIGAAARSADLRRWAAWVALGLPAAAWFAAPFVFNPHQFVGGGVCEASARCVELGDVAPFEL